jgi:hypothetical protein
MPRYFVMLALPTPRRDCHGARAPAVSLVFFSGFCQLSVFDTLTPD